MKLLCLELVSEFGKYDNLDRGDVVTHARMRSKTDKQAGPAEKQFVNAASQRLENSPRAFHCWLPGSHAVVGHEPRHKKRKGLPSLDRSSIGRAISLVSGFRRFLLPFIGGRWKFILGSTSSSFPSWISAADWALRNSAPVPPVAETEDCGWRV